MKNLIKERNCTRRRKRKTAGKREKEIKDLVKEMIAKKKNGRWETEAGYRWKSGGGRKHSLLEGFKQKKMTYAINALIKIKDNKYKMKEK